MESAVKNATDEKFEKAVDMKVKVSFAEAVGIQQVKTIATKATVSIIKEDENVQKLGTGLLKNGQVLYDLNAAVTNYVQTETKWPLSTIRKPQCKEKSRN